MVEVLQEQVQVLNLEELEAEVLVVLDKMKRPLLMVLMVVLV